MRTISSSRGMKAILLAGGACAAAFAMPAYAQNSGSSDVESNEPIIVTGSRIARPDYSSNSPTVSVDQTLLQNSATAALETNLNKLPQFSPAQTPTLGGDIQPTATNTPGAATISLRGIGSNRNLVLLDGRRSTPSNASGVVDISTIPSAAIQRVEIISGGASATYGADAIAGVTNFILKKNVNGLELDGQLGLTQEGDGLEWQISGIAGSDFADGRGNVSIAASINTRDASYQRDRKWYRDMWANPDIAGTQFFINNPGIYFSGNNMPTAAATMFPKVEFAPKNPNYTVYANQDGSAFINGSWSDPDTYAYHPMFEGYNGSNDGYNDKITNAGVLTANNTDSYLILPLTRYNFFTRGNYEINDWIGVFGQGLFSHVSTYTRQEPGPITAGWSVAIDPTKLDRDQLSEDMWTLLDSRPDENAPFELRTLLPQNREGFTDVMTYNLIAGLEGSIPGTDWTWDASVNHGISVTSSRQTGIYSLERLRTVLNSGNFGEGFFATGNSKDSGFGASSGSCTTGMNPFKDPSTYSEDCYQATRADLKNRSTMRQTIVEANLTGKILTLPAGDLRGAFGASYRELNYEFLNDTLTTQGTSWNDQALGIYPSADSFGYYDTKEVYGELLIPVLADLPAIKSFSLEVGGRISDYSTTGSSTTYKILGDWEVTDWLRFRGGFNRAERSPNISELFLSSQQTFGFNMAGDPCSTANPGSFSANPLTNTNAANVRAICGALMDRSGDPNAQSIYYSNTQSNSSSGFAWPTLVGTPTLDTEKAKTWTAGVVINSPWTSNALRALRLSVDFYDIQVKDAIAPVTIAAVLQQCFDPAFNALAGTNPTAAANTENCRKIVRNTTGELGTVYTEYANSGRFHVQGIDAQLDWNAEVGPGRLSANVLFNYLTKFRSSALQGLPMVEYKGTLGTTENGLNTGAYEYKVLTNLNYTIDGFGIGLQWQHLPSVEDSNQALFNSPEKGAKAYNIFSLNGSYAATDNVNFRFGVENLFNVAPPLTNYNPNNTNPAVTGQLIGGSFNAGYYDTVGRRFFIGANVKF